MTRAKKNLFTLQFILILSYFASSLPVLGVSLRERIANRQAIKEQNNQNELEAQETNSSIRLPAGVQVLRDISYGKDNQQRFDVYLPQKTNQSPIILMVHGGAWAVGDKSAAGVVQNKVNRWAPKGFIFVSSNYRLLPKAQPVEQAEDIAAALAFAQSKAERWGGDKNKVILMGHSAGAHLVALLSASPSIATKAGALPWIGTIALDSAALNLVPIMENRHYRFYDRAFGNKKEYWISASPFHRLQKNNIPFLAVCSSRRDISCEQAKSYVEKSISLGIRAEVLKQDLAHNEINHQLGEDNDYTRQVEAFIKSLKL